MDLNCKLCFIGIVMPGCVNSSTRFIIWLEPILGFGNRLVFPLFNDAEYEHGLPDQIVSNKVRPCLILSPSCSSGHTWSIELILHCQPSKVHGWQDGAKNYSSKDFQLSKVCRVYGGTAPTLPHHEPLRCL